MSTMVHFFTKSDAPHLPVLALAGKHHRDDCEACKLHKVDPSKPKLCTAPCAACDWNDPQVRKHRATVKAAAEAGLRKKLGPLKPHGAPAPLFPKGFNPAAVVLPPMPKHTFPPTWTEESYLRDGVAVRYLEAMGAKSKKNTHGGLTWSCGCNTSTKENGGRVASACARHDAAFHGRDDN
jgi:hypothetical protein